MFKNLLEILLPKAIRVNLPNLSFREKNKVPIKNFNLMSVHLRNFPLPTSLYFVGSQAIYNVNACTFAYKMCGYLSALSLHKNGCFLSFLMLWKG